MHPTPTHHTYIERELDTQAAIIAEQMNIKNSIITTDTIKYVTYKTIKLIKVTLVYELQLRGKDVCTEERTQLKRPTCLD